MQSPSGPKVYPKSAEVNLVKIYMEGCDVEWLAPSGGLVGVGSI